MTILVEALKECIKEKDQSIKKQLRNAKTTLSQAIRNITKLVNEENDSQETFSCSDKLIEEEEMKCDHPELESLINTSLKTNVTCPIMI